MRIDNGVYRSVKMDWENITLPLKAGTPINIDGEIANDDNAIGLVPQDVSEATVQLPEYIYILIAGEVYLPEVEELSGLTLEADAISAMGGIRFYTESVNVEKGGNSFTPMPWAGYLASDADLETVVAAINDMVDLLVAAGLMEEEVIDDDPASEVV